jgi:hypothetical protein
MFYSEENQRSPVDFLYRRESILAVHRLPQSQNNILKYCVLQICLYNMKSVAVHWVGLMTQRECCIDLPFSYHVTGVG